MLKRIGYEVRSILDKYDNSDPNTITMGTVMSDVRKLASLAKLEFQISGVDVPIYPIGFRAAQIVNLLTIPGYYSKVKNVGFYRLLGLNFDMHFRYFDFSVTEDSYTDFTSDYEIAKYDNRLLPMIDTVCNNRYDAELALLEYIKVEPKLIDTACWKVLLGLENIQKEPAKMVITTGEEAAIKGAHIDCPLLELIHLLDGSLIGSTCQIMEPQVVDGCGSEKCPIGRY